MKKILTLTCLACSLISYAQETGTLRLFLSPPAETVLIDDEPLEFGNKINLEPGTHSIKAWSPDREPLDTVIEISAGEKISFFYRFENSQSYNEHLADVRNYNAKRNVRLTLPAITTTMIGGALLFTYFKGRQLEELAEDKYQLYQYTGADIAGRRAEFEEAQEKYRPYYYAQFAEYAALAVSSYFLIKGIRWVIKNPQPERKQDSDPFTLNQIGFTRIPQAGYGIGLSLNIN